MDYFYYFLSSSQRLSCDAKFDGLGGLTSQVARKSAVTSQPLELEPDLFGFNQDYKHRQLHHALEQIETLYGKNRIKTGTRVLLEQEAKHLVRDKAKCPFIPQREMEVKMNRVPEEVNELVYEEDWKPLEEAPTDTALLLPRTWGRSTSRQQKFS